VLQAHQPAFEIGAVDLNEEFKVKESKIEEKSLEEQVIPSVE
jgi:hypothetical protein